MNIKSADGTMCAKGGKKRLEKLKLTDVSTAERLLTLYTFF